MRTAPSGKSYIGQTSFTEERRWKEHCYAAFHEHHQDYNTPLSKAIRKYGADGFICKILEDEINDVELLKKREIYWIEFYNTFNFGFNATMGGDGNKKIKTEDVTKLWNDGHCVRDIAILLNIHPASVLRHLNKTAQECELRGPVYKSKNSYKHFGDYQIGKSVPVTCFDMNTGKRYKTFSSIYEAARFVNAKCATTIKKATNGILRSAFGYYWKQGLNIESLSKEELAAKKEPQIKHNCHVVCVEKNEMYSSCVYAEEITGICYRGIAFACQGKSKIAGGFHWRYATKEDEQNLILIQKAKVHKQAHNIRSVLCVETGVIYSSLKEAANAIGASSSSVFNCCKGKTKTSKGFHFKYTQDNVQQDKELKHNA